MRWQEEVARDLGFTAVLHLVYYGVPYLVFRWGKPNNVISSETSSNEAAPQNSSPELSSALPLQSKRLLVGGAVFVYTSAPLLIGLSPRFPPYIKLMVATAGWVFSMRTVEMLLFREANQFPDTYVKLMIEHCIPGRFVSEDSSLASGVKELCKSIAFGTLFYYAPKAIEILQIERALETLKLPRIYVDSALFVIPFYLVLQSLCSFSYSLFAFMGYRVSPIFDKPLCSLSVTEFWGRRWNLYVQGMLKLIVFKPIWSYLAEKNAHRGEITKGVIPPLVALLSVFGVSGLLHEYWVYCAIGKLSGEMFLFFMAQALLCALEKGFTSTRVGKWVSSVFPRPMKWATTMLLLGATLPLFVRPLLPISMPRRS